MQRVIRFGLICLILTIAVWLASCQATVSPMITTNERILPNVATPTSSVTATYPVTPTLAILSRCNAGSVLFLINWNPNVDGVYLACSDGSSLQQIISSNRLLSKNWTLNEIAVSPNGHTLAILAHDFPTISQSSIYFWDLLGNREIAAYSTSYVIYSITWLSDSSHIAYLAKDKSGANPTRIEVVDATTQPISTILKSDLDLGNLTGSDDGMQLMYFRAFDKYSTHNDIAYLAEVDCVDTQHACTLGSQRSLDRFPVGPSMELSWLPGSKTVVTLNTALDEAGNVYDVLELWSLDGNNLQRVDLRDKIAGAAYDYVPPSVSLDGKRVAFIAAANIFILNLVDGQVENLSMKLGGLQNPHFDQVVWVPEH